MKTNRFMYGFLIGVLVMGILALAGAWLISNETAVASEGATDVGRYQVSAWASYSGVRIHHSGYYVIDTTTGKIVEKGHEIHGSGEPEEKP